MKEESLYPVVVEFLKTEKKCIAARERLGHKYVGQADAFGITDLGGIYESNLIGYAVEVKTEKAPIGKNLGQALGYSLFSHRSYFAVPDSCPFDEEDKEMANMLGVGLLEIGRSSAKEILTARHHEPMSALFQTIVEILGYAKCKICNEYYPIKGWSAKAPSKIDPDKIYYRWDPKKEKVLFSKAKELGRWSLIVCPSCLKSLELAKKA